MALRPLAGTEGLVLCQPHLPHLPHLPEEAPSSTGRKRRLCCKQLVLELPLGMVVMQSIMQSTCK